MTGRITPRALLLEQHKLIDLIERQEIELNRQRCQLELQFRRSADMQVQLDRIGNGHVGRAKESTTAPVQRRHA